MDHGSTVTALNTATVMISMADKLLVKQMSFKTTAGINRQASQCMSSIHVLPDCAQPSTTFTREPNGEFLMLSSSTSSVNVAFGGISPIPPEP